MMNIITALPIYRNRFQRRVLNFSQKKFSAGSLIFIPYPKTKEKPALVIQVENLKEKKLFLRKQIVPLRKINNSFEIKFLPKKIIEELQTQALKINQPLSESLNKFFPKKIIREINQISETSEIKNIRSYAQKLSPIFIEKKLTQFSSKKTAQQPIKKIRGVQTIGILLSQTRVKKTSLHSEKHYLADEIRNYFGETAKKGTGSFSFYLGFFGKIPLATIYQFWAEVRESRQPLAKQQKIFWWKIGQFLKTESEKRKSNNKK